MWMGANPILDLGSLEFAGAVNGFPHGKKEKRESPIRVGGNKMKKTTSTYPRFVDVDRNGVFQKVFVTSNGNEEWCSPTGRELQNSPEPMDHWLEYEDSEGELHYGR